MWQSAAWLLGGFESFFSPCWGLSHSLCMLSRWPIIELHPHPVVRIINTPPRPMCRRLRPQATAQREVSGHVDMRPAGRSVSPCSRASTGECGNPIPSSFSLHETSSSAPRTLHAMEYMLLPHRPQAARPTITKPLKPWAEINLFSLKSTISKSWLTQLYLFR